MSKKEEQEKVEEVKQKEQVQQEEVKELTTEEKFTELNDKHLRLHAEFENFKRFIKIYDKMKIQKAVLG